MKEISMPKQEIATIINSIEVEGLTIFKSQKKPKIFVKLPAITFSQIGDYTKKQFGELVIMNENFSFQIDIWGEKSADVSKIVREVKKKMLLAGYNHTGGNDFDDPSGILRYILIFERKV